MTVGTDSYVSVVEADAYINALYSATEVGDEWGIKSVAQKESLLVTACADIESLPFVGQKLDRRQELSFPRAPMNSVPQSVKQAQIEIALFWLKEALSPAGGGASERIALQKQGVKSFSLGDLSESYNTVSSTITDFPFLASGKIGRLLKRYLSGGYTIC